MNPHYPVVAQRARHRCEYCHAPEAVFNFSFEVEHIIPTALSGDDEEPNLALACRACNLGKSNHLTGRDEVTGADSPLFSPRQNQWEEHFQVDPDAGSILGLTAIGRVTIERLQMNSSVQLEARRQWMRLGLFP